jgi:signal transduction histidine kinase
LDLLQLVGEHLTHAVISWDEELGIFANLSKWQLDALTAKKDALEAQLAKAETERRGQVAMEDIHHQMKGPLAESERRVNKLLDNMPRPVPSSELFEIRSMLHRSSLMSKKIGLLAKLDKGERLALRISPVEAKDLARLAGEISKNTSFRIAEHRNIRIECDSDSIWKLTPLGLVGDLELISEALNNLLDNAVKYSYRETKIRVFAGQTKSGRFYMAVTNIGFPIHPEEVNRCRERYWRGESAEGSAGEGNGIGLWIVDHIMRAHGGALDILPTRPNDGLTEVRLIFSVI